MCLSQLLSYFIFMNVRLCGGGHASVYGCMFVCMSVSVCMCMSVYVCATHAYVCGMAHMLKCSQFSLPPLGGYQTLNSGW